MKQDGKAIQKENEKLKENKLKAIEICDSNERELKIVLMKKLNKM